MNYRQRHRGFGLVDALVALSLLAITLLGACGSLHFALQATRSAAWQARAVDLIADLDEDLQHADAAVPFATHLDAWRTRLQQALPVATLAALDARNLPVGAQNVGWLDLRITWSGMQGPARAALQLPLAHGVGAP
jgi:type II secretory pathway component PulJ